MNDENRSDEEAGILTRTAEVAVSLLLFAFGATVVFDSYRLGASWGSDGPQSGYFPFYIGLLICLASLATLGQAMFAQWRDRKKIFSGALPGTGRCSSPGGPCGRCCRCFSRRSSTCCSSS